MFGFRPDGRRVSSVDPLVRITPYFMHMRCDAQVFLQHKLDYEVLARYLAKKSMEGERLTFMQIIIAAYVRAVGQHPEVNRFIMNKQFFARNNCTVSFSMLRDTGSAEVEETAVKVKFDLHDTIFDVRDRINHVVETNRPMGKKNFTDKLIRFLFATPGLPSSVVGLVRLLDRYGLCPGVLLDAIPFHTGLFVTNMSSIGMHSVYHHIYNFGNTSLFMSMGTLERDVVMDGEGNARLKRLMPIGITADERVCAGAVYAGFFSTMMAYLKDPVLLETPPESVKFDKKVSYSVPKVEKVPQENEAPPMKMAQ